MPRRDSLTFVRAQALPFGRSWVAHSDALPPAFHPAAFLGPTFDNF